jgi:acid phosphatase
MYHRSLGYGNPLAPTLGMPWISASARLLTGTADASATNSSAGRQSLFVSFTHREGSLLVSLGRPHGSPLSHVEPPFIVTALGLFNTSNASMPADALNYERVWRTSDILPFLANVGLERLECNASATPTNASGVFVRVLVNAAPMPLPGCSAGPDASCALANFTQFVAGT